MNDYYLQKLEFNTILEKLSTFCSTDLGKTISLQLKISNNPNTVKEKLNETAEAVNLIYKNSTPSFYDIQDIQIYLMKLESTQILNAKGLIDLKNIFLSAQDLKQYFSQDYIDKYDFPILDSLFSQLYSNEGIISKVSSSMTS